jgi:hypothetical protein
MVASLSGLKDSPGFDERVAVLIVGFEILKCEDLKFGAGQSGALDGGSNAVTISERVADSCITLRCLSLEPPSG